MKRQTWILLALVLLLLSACSDAEDGNPSDGDTWHEDGDASDGDASDGDAPDGDVTDGDRPDGDRPDGDTAADGDDYWDDVDGDCPDGDWSYPDGDTAADGDEDSGWYEDGDDNTDSYEDIVENGFTSTESSPFSTFSIDVDTASYSQMRYNLTNGRMPPPNSVRIEEFINYFDYDYEPPTDGSTFNVFMDSADCPWKDGHHLLRIALKGKLLEEDERPDSNLVFLIDVSGSMSSHNKLPLVKEGLKLLVNQLREGDRVALVVYAGASGVVLPSTSCANKTAIIDALERLEAGGSTAGAAGIRLAYQVAEENFISNGNNRVILATDGDFNVGVTNNTELKRLIEEKAQTGVFLSIYGFGMGNYKDDRLEMLSNAGNGVYGYIDNLDEAKKIFVNDFLGSLYTIAKDVKIQIEFNPDQIAAYRLIGYENRVLNYEDFEDDTKDAGDLGSGHTVTAFYQIVPVGVEVGYDLKPGEDTTEQRTSFESNEQVKVHLRHKPVTFQGPVVEESILETFALAEESHVSFAQAHLDFRFASMVASFGMLLRGSAYKGDTSYDIVHTTAGGALGEDYHGYRAEFLTLVRAAESLDTREPDNQTED